MISRNLSLILMTGLVVAVLGAGAFADTGNLVAPQRDADDFFPAPEPTYFWETIGTGYVCKITPHASHRVEVSLAESPECLPAQRNLGLYLCPEGNPIGSCPDHDDPASNQSYWKEYMIPPALAMLQQAMIHKQQVIVTRISYYSTVSGFDAWSVKHGHRFTIKK